MSHTEPAYVVEYCVQQAYRLWRSGCGEDEIRPWLHAVDLEIDMQTGVILPREYPPTKPK